MFFIFKLWNNTWYSTNLTSVNTLIGSAENKDADCDKNHYCKFILSIYLIYFCLYTLNYSSTSIQPFKYHYIVSHFAFNPSNLPAFPCMIPFNLPFSCLYRPAYFLKIHPLSLPFELVLLIVGYFLINHLFFVFVYL